MLTLFVNFILSVPSEKDFTLGQNELLFKMLSFKTKPIVTDV